MHARSQAEMTFTDTLKNSQNGIPYYKFIGMADPVEKQVYNSFELTGDIIYDTLFTGEQVLTLKEKVI